MKKQRFVQLFVLLSIMLFTAGAVSTALGQGSDTQAGVQTGGIQVAASWHGDRDTWDDYDREASLELLAAAGVQYVRLPIHWGRLEPEDNQFNGDYLEELRALFELIVAKGLIPTPGVLGPTPTWAWLPNPPIPPILPPGCNLAEGHNPAPLDPQVFGDFMEDLVPLFPEAPAWEVWNEPNLKGFLCAGDDPLAAPEVYAQMLQAAYTAIKAHNEDLVVVFGGVSGVDAEWIQCAYESQTGIQGYFDAMAVHPYRSDNPPDLPDEPPIPPLDDCDDSSKLFPRHVAAVHELMQAWGDGDKPIWATEFGWSNHPNYWWTPGWARGVTLEEQAAYTVRFLEMMQTEYPYVTVATYYTTRDECIEGIPQPYYHPGNRGLLYIDLAPKPVYDAVAAWINGVPEGDSLSSALTGDPVRANAAPPALHWSCQPCVARALAQQIADTPSRAALLELLYQARDKKLAETPFGQQIIQQYYAHSPELVRLLAVDATLRADMLALLQESAPLLRSWVAGDGEARLDGAWIAEVDGLVRAVAGIASPALRADLLATWDRVNLAHYAGQTIAETWAAINR